MISQLRNLNAFPEYYLETGETEAVQNFINKEAVLFPHQSTIMYYLMQNMGDDVFTMESFPSCNEKYNDDYSSYIMDINDTLTPGLCISSDCDQPDLCADICLEFAKKVNKINVEDYGYLNITQSDLTYPKSLPKPVEQFHDMLNNQKKTTAYWYALLNSEDGSNFRHLTKRLFAGEISTDEFIALGANCLNFEH